MRARNIKSAFFENENLAECEPLARILFIGLWGAADREGRLEDRPKRLKHQILGYDDCDAEALLCDLEDSGFIHRYEIDGNGYIWVPKFLKHQRPHFNERDSVIPPSDRELAAKDDSPTDQGKKDFALIPDTGKRIPENGSLNPDTTKMNPDVIDEGAKTRPAIDGTDFERVLVAVQSAFHYLDPPVDFSLEDYRLFSATYPDVHLHRELVRMGAWLNPEDSADLAAVDRDRRRKKQPRQFMMYWLNNSQNAAEKERPAPDEPEPTLEWYLDLTDRAPGYGEKEAKADFEEAHRRWTELP